MASQSTNQKSIGKLVRDRRVSMGLSIEDIARQTGISASHLSRIEGGERRPSGHVLQKAARSLKFEESELMFAAGYLTKVPATDSDALPAFEGHLDPFVARMLAQEPVEVQRLAYAMALAMKSAARDLYR